MAIGRLDNGAPTNTVPITIAGIARSGEESVAAAARNYRPTSATRPVPPDNVPMSNESYRAGPGGRPVPSWSSVGTSREVKGG